MTRIASRIDSESAPETRSRRAIAGRASCLVLVLCATAGGGCSATRPHQPTTSAASAHALAGRIWDVAAGRYVQAEQLSTVLARAPIVLLGEKHDNPSHHSHQAALIAALIRAGKSPTIVMEMIAEEDQAALDSYLARGDATAAGLGPAVRWEKRGWPEWRIYQPIARVVLEARLPVVPGGISRATLRQRAHAAHAGADSRPGQATDAALPVSLPPAARAALARSVREAHCGYASDRTVRVMVLAQQLRDAFMARQLARHAPQTAVLVAGNGHVRRDRGVPFFLRRAHNIAANQIQAVAFVETRTSATSPGDYPEAATGDDAPFDFVWFTERVDDEDPCERFREQLRRMKQQRSATSRPTI